MGGTHDDGSKIFKNRSADADVNPTPDYGGPSPEWGRTGKSRGARGLPGGYLKAGGGVGRGGENGVNEIVLTVKTAMIIL